MQSKKTIIEVNNLTFRYDLRKEEHTLSAVSFLVKQGEWIAVVGDNGSGKSTLARLMVGLLQAEQGQIKVEGVQLDQDSKWTIRQKIGLVFQNPENQFIGTTVQDDVAFGLENSNMPYSDMKQVVEEALALVDMVDYREHDPSRLSGGQKQRVALAGILAFQPKVIILDEAFVMLDPRSRAQLITTLKKLQDEKNITIISVTHDMNEAAMADRMIVMDQGKIIEDDIPSNVFVSSPQLEAPFVERLRRYLEQQGRNVPRSYMTEDEMVKWLCK